MESDTRGPPPRKCLVCARTPGAAPASVCICARATYSALTPGTDPDPPPAQFRPARRQNESRLRAPPTQPRIRPPGVHFRALSPIGALFDSRATPVSLPDDGLCSCRCAASDESCARAREVQRALGARPPPARIVPLDSTQAPHPTDSTRRRCGPRLVDLERRIAPRHGSTPNAAPQIAACPRSDSPHPLDAPPRPATRLLRRRIAPRFDSTSRRTPSAAGRSTHPALAARARTRRRRHAANRAHLRHADARTAASALLRAPVHSRGRSTPPRQPPEPRAHNGPRIRERRCVRGTGFARRRCVCRAARASEARALVLGSCSF
ncbi:hypothetical protein B0H15DRAFT_953730 [Mycena belliarum]|uniref:Uncharacterized protein n=1 Tax=Mycena belliarum TaxID=1033014 RepID=A0AAD6TVQ7_9AGAR|nr:hypothetical protein B0H15DRAFT_953730 [Mycena belliae]